MFGLEGRKNKAIAYYRHSAEDKQENSVTIQNDHALKFSSDNDLQLIHYESDEGVSGLSAARPGFERLFNDWIINPDAPDFQYVLVLDETRWGRWQDPDEAAYWTMICKKHGKQVIYISRGFPKEEQKLLSSLETSIGRYMAAEYSRQLSDKVWHGSIKVSEQGFSAGGTAPYGYNRVLLDEKHNRIGILRPGQRKLISNQRVTFEPANDETQTTVKEIFTTFVTNWIHPAEIAEMLNERDIPSATGKTWDTSKIVRVLTNETYTGTRIYNKTWGRLKQKQHKNPTEEWVKTVDAFEGIIDQQTFNTAQERLYWTMTSRWHYGIRKINHTQAALRGYISQLIEHYDDDARYEVLRKLPVSFGLTYKDNTAKRCFRITEAMRHYPVVIGVAVSMFAKDKIDAVYALPIELFDVGNFLIASEKNTELNDYILNTETTAERLLEVCDAVAGVVSART